MKVKQITAWVDNRPGEVARIASALASAKINISAISCWNAGTESPIHLLVSSPAKAKRVLQDVLTAARGEFASNAFALRAATLQ